MRYTVYLVISPKEPTRACVSAFPPSPERRRALEAEHCEIFQADIEVPLDKYAQFQVVNKTVATPCPYIGKRVRAKVDPGISVVGTVRPSKLPGCIEVAWSTKETGTFMLTAFKERIERGIFTFVEEES